MENPIDIQNEAWSYFTTIFQNTPSFDFQKTVETLDNINLPTITSIHFSILSNPVQQDEIDRAVFEIKSDSAPGPDGFHARFFQHFWTVLKQDISAMICQIFST